MITPLAVHLSENQLLGYIGGIIDGEGYIGITATTVKGKKTPCRLYSLCISVVMTTTPAIDALRIVFGGEIRFVQPNNAKTGLPYKLQYMWRLRKREHIKYFIDRMLWSRCILVKRQQLELAKEYLTVTENRLQDPELREAFYQKFKLLNK